MTHSVDHVHGLRLPSVKCITLRSGAAVRGCGEVLADASRAEVDLCNPFRYAFDLMTVKLVRVCRQAQLSQEDLKLAVQGGDCKRSRRVT